MTGPVAVLVLAAALLVAPVPPGLGRLRTIAVSPEGGPAPPSGAAGPAARPAGAAVACVAAGVLTWAVTGAVVGGVLVAVVAAGLAVVLRRWRPGPPLRDDPVDLAAAWTQLAVCLEAGLPVAAAVAAAAGPLDGRAGAALRRVAGLLELGADAGQAWAAAGQVPSLAAFARAAGRSAGTGSALARAARTEGARLRAGLVDAAEARAQRAAVLITAPLGLCFLPAFLVLGVAPVVIGLVGEAVRSW